MRPLTILSLIFCIFLRSGTLASGAVPHSHPPKYVSTDWGLKEGLPQSSVNNIIQTRDGYIWLATFGGLVRFNGTTFTTYNRSNTKGLRSDRILNIYEDRSGAIWCGTEDGFSRFQDGSFRTYQIIDSIFNYSPLMVTEDAWGTLWITTNSKLYRFENDTFVFVPVIVDPVLAGAAVLDPGGTWLVHEKNLMRTIGDSAVLVKDFSRRVQYKFEHVVQDPLDPDRIWIATSGSGVLHYHLPTGQVRHYTPADGLPSPYIKRLALSRSKMVMSMGFNGSSVFDGSRFVPLQSVSGTDDREYNEAMQDKEGNYWVGSQSRGLRRLRSTVITTIGNEEGLNEGKMLSLIRLSNGKMLFGTNCGGIYEYTNGRAEYSAINASLVNLCVWSIFEDSKKRLWIGSRVLMRYDSLRGKGTLLTSSQGFNGEDIFAITEDSKGNIWIGCVNGLHVFDGKQFRQYTTADGLTHNDVRAVFEDAAGTVWIGTTNGLNKYDNGTLTPVPIVLNGDTASEPLSLYIRSMYQDEDGTQWFGTYGSGIVRMKDGKFSAVTTQHGLADNIISHIHVCRKGFVWIGSNQGIMRVKREELIAVADGKIKMLHSYMYGTEDGMQSPETNGGFQPSIATDGEGNVYFPTVNGVAVVATERVEENDVIPPVKIEKVLRRDIDFGLPEQIVLPHDSADIEIQYASLSFVDPAKHQYKFMIVGVDQQWNYVGNRTTAYYTNIPPGEWIFYVVATNNDGVWNETGDFIAITILPPYWNTWWFYTIIGLLFIVLGPSAYFIRVSQLKKEKARQQMFAERLIDSQEQERRRIAMELHDGLGQQILIIKNRAELAIKSIGDPEAIADQLREIAGSAVISINDVRAISHGLRPVHLEQFGLTDTVINLCEQLNQTSTIEWITHVDDIDNVIPQEKQINFYRIIQEGVNNILRHSSATQASIMIRRSEKEVVLSLWDNGKGFDPGEKISGAGMGLTGIWERAYTLGGTYDVKSAPGEGTSLKIIIPIGHHE